MERRRLVLDEAPKQLELEIPAPTPRRRLTLIDEADPKRQEGESVQGVVARREAMPKAQPLTGARYSAWTDALPPCSGFWDIKQKSARVEENLRMWFDSETARWWNPNLQMPEGVDPPPKMPHTIFSQSHQWRGLEQRPAEGYSYDLERTPLTRRRITL